MLIYNELNIFDDCHSFLILKRTEVPAKWGQRSAVFKNIF